MPGEGSVLRQEQLTIVADTASDWKRRRGFGQKIWTGAGGKTKIPHFVRAHADASAEGWVFEPHFGEVPIFGSRSQSCVFDFHGVIELVDGAGRGRARGVARSPDDR